MSLVEKRIRQILAEKNIPFEEFEHGAVYTCEEAAGVRGLESAGQGIKDAPVSVSHADPIKGNVIVGRNL